MSVTNPVGWLPYGSDDDSVLFYDPLTSAPNNTRIPCTTFTTAGAGTISHDSVLGAKFNGKSYNIQGLTGADQLLYGGQISFEVERAWISTYDASGTASGSEGALTNQTQTALSILTTSSHLCRWPQRTGTDAQPIGFLHFGGAITQKNFYSAANGSPAINSLGKPDFVTVNIGWVGGPSGGRWYFAVDGVVLTYWDSAVTGVSGIGANWYIGADRSTANTFVSSHYIRNLQVSTRPPMFAVHPMLRKIAFWGDSLVNDLAVTHFAGNPPYDADHAITAVKVLQKHGLYAGAVIAQENGGYTVTDSGANQLESVRATLTATNPTIVVMRAGTNDVDTDWATFAALFEDDLKDHISTIMAVDSVQGMVIGNVPDRFYGDDGDTYRANVKAANAIFAGIEDWWDSTGATAAGVSEKAGMVKVVDVYSALGGENPPAKTFIGQLTGDNDDLHLASYGNYLLGVAEGNAILSLLK